MVLKRERHYTVYSRLSWIKLIVIYNQTQTNSHNPIGRKIKRDITPSTQDFKQIIKDAIRQLPKHNVTIIDENMNAAVGSNDTVGFSFHGKTNRNGNMRLGLTKECELVSISTKFQKKKGKLWTHTYPKGEEDNSTISLTRSGKTV